MHSHLIFLISFFCGCSAFASMEGIAVPLEYAQNFEIHEFPEYRQLTVKNTSRQSTRIDQYALVPHGQPVPRLPPEVTVIRTPVQRIVALETVYIGHLEALNALDQIVGAATTNFISNEAVRADVANGRITEVQIGQSLDIERLIQLQPDLILTSISGDPNFDVPPTLERTQLPIVFSAGYMEQHPLARAEWIKFIAALVGQEAVAEEHFNQTAQRYEALANLSKEVKQRPSVFCGAPYSGVWHIPGGQSYTAQAIQDAGGQYLWSEDSSQGSLPLDTERVFFKAARADIWIHPSHYRSMAALLAADARFGKFRAARNGAVFNNSRQCGAHGGNAIWERGVVEPDRVLADLIYIFHPELLPEHAWAYYEQLK